MARDLFSSSTTSTYNNGSCCTGAFARSTGSRSDLQSSIIPRSALCHRNASHWMAPWRLHLGLAKRRRNLHSTLASATYPNAEPAASLNGEGRQGPMESTDGFAGLVNGTWHSDNDDEMLRLIEGFGDFYPILRTYRNDLCSIELCGCAVRSRVLAAMAADPNFTAARDLLMGRRMTVLQTVLPGSSGCHSTVSTKLFAPSLRVVNKSKKFSFPDGVDAGEFVHKFFEAVQMEGLSKFYIELHVPGTVRDMSALKREEMVKTVCSFEASNRAALDQFGEAITSYAVDCMKKKVGVGAYQGLLSRLWKRSGWAPSSGAPVKLCMLSVEEMENQVQLLTKSTSEVLSGCTRLDHLWWPAPAHAMVSIKGHVDNATEDWIHEYVPMHKLQIDVVMLDAKVTGACTSLGLAKEILLTHAQLVDLAGALDLYYEDRFTLSEKRLNAGTALDFRSAPRSKMTKFLEASSLIGIIFGAGVFAWLVAARMRRPTGSFVSEVAPSSTVSAGVSKPLIVRNDKAREAVRPINAQLAGEEMEALCKLVVSHVTTAFSWHLQVQSSSGKGAWTENHGNRPPTLVEKPAPHEAHQHGINNVAQEGKPHIEMRMLPGIRAEADDFSVVDEGTSSLRSDIDGEKAALLYQVVLSRDGGVLGFQPLNQEAVSLWSTFPFARILHKQKKLKPGLWERPLKFEGPPMDAVVIELRVCMDPVTPFVSASPFPL